MISEKIVKWAMLFDGIKEIGNNEGWENVYFDIFKMTFQELMIMVGWKNFHSWCAYYGELVWKLAYYDAMDSPMIAELNKLFSPLATVTYRNLKDAGFKTSRIPKVGAIVAWQKYKDGKKTIYGHLGIVIGASDNYYRTSEGNTNAAGGRNGNMVAKKTHQLKTKFKENGLNLLGFIHPKEIQV